MLDKVTTISTSSAPLQSYDHNFTSSLPRDIMQDSEALKQLFSELEKNAEKVEELVEMETGAGEASLVQQVHRPHATRLRLVK